MSTITTINTNDRLTDSKAVINTNFSNLNTDKAEKSANLSDMTVPNTALNNILPTQTGQAGKQLQTDGTNTSWVSPSGAPLATNVVQGITALTVVAADPLLPKAVGDNDPRMLTTDQKAACAGTGTPSGANKFVTADTDALKELLANKDTTTTLGTSDTKYPSQNAVKVYVDTQVPTAYTWKTGSQLLASADTSRTCTTDVYAKSKAITIRKAGVVNVKFTLTYGTSAGTTFYGRIYVNGVARGTERTVTTGNTEFSEDITVAVGDDVQVYIHNQATTGGTASSISNFRIFTAQNETTLVTTDTAV